MRIIQFILIVLLQGYRYLISPIKNALFGPMSKCRFTPSCSEYALDAVRVYGPFQGGYLSARRLCRCHPWGGCGHDPVPQLKNSKCRVQSEERPSPQPSPEGRGRTASSGLVCEEEMDGDSKLVALPHG